MLKIISQSNWFTGLLIFFMPVLLIFFLGSQMAYSQVKSKYEAYQNISEISRASELAVLPAGQVIMVRGQISRESCQLLPPTSCGSAQDLIIFRERPAADREARFQEAFEPVFPIFVIEVAGGKVAIVPSLAGDRVIRHELHAVPAGDRLRTGFQVGDKVTVQGRWQPGQPPTLVDATGISGTDKAQLMLEWQAAFQQVGWARNGLGLLSLAGLIFLIIQLRRARTGNSGKEKWPPQKTTTAPIA